MPNLDGAASAWADLRQRGMPAKTFADLLSIDPAIGSHIDAARAAGHDDLTILNNLGGVLPRQPDPQAGLRMKLSRIDEMPEEERSFARFELLTDHGVGSGPWASVEHAVDRDEDRRANLGEYDRWDGTSNDLLMQIASKDNQRLKRQYIREKGPWPTDPDTGRPYVVAHKRAVADGGEQALWNIEPLPQDVHDARHKADRDHVRWPQRKEVAKGYDGKILRPGQSPGKITEPQGPFEPRSMYTGPPRKSVAPNVLGPNGEVRVPGPPIRWTGDLHPSGGSTPETVAPAKAAPSRLNGLGKAVGALSIVPSLATIIAGAKRRATFEEMMVDLYGPALADIYRQFHPKARKERVGKLIT